MKYLQRSLSRHTAGDHGDGVEVCVGYQVPEHPQAITHSIGVDVCLVEVSMDKVGEPDDGVEQVTEGQVEDQDD